MILKYRRLSDKTPLPALIFADEFENVGEILLVKSEKFKGGEEIFSLKDFEIVPEKWRRMFILRVTGSVVVLALGVTGVFTTIKGLVVGEFSLFAAAMLLVYMAFVVFMAINMKTEVEMHLFGGIVDHEKGIEIYFQSHEERDIFQSQVTRRR